MKAVADCTIKELEAALTAGSVSEEFLAACREDPRKAAARLVRRYEKAQAEHERLLKLYAYEHAAWARGHEIVAGVDEAGRGPLCGRHPAARPLPAEAQRLEEALGEGPRGALR